ncbi:hypothetical protein B0F90DRAFT_1816914 [Multifurca ochricompacta]|uniref:Uncharacterized protein n=1 Tax=Multifurca ochricompacta TaxID=376703 RepID=A0AAD4M556_9AGAM|nr:hypothetical protein B0F90DRAFT_1816914 [Multifurca ochricompacta]
MDVDQASLISSRRLPVERLNRFMDLLRFAIAPDASDQEIEDELTSIYGRFEVAYRGHQTNFVSLKVFKENAIRRQKDFFGVLKWAARADATEDDCQAVVTHSVFWPKPVLKGARSIELEEIAVVNSWNAKFVYDAPLYGLKRHITREIELIKERGKKVYARYCSIVQSSGMGKSRLIDELSKKDFVIPINLRPEDSKGYPPPDHELRRFLALGDGDNADLAYSRACHFMLALFEETEILLNKFNAPNRADRIYRFREYMSRGQDMTSTGKDRKSFYEGVVARANRSMNAPRGVDANQLREAFDNLKNVVNDPSSRDLCPEDTHVDIYVMFDEAHSLTNPFSEHDSRSPFTELRRTLRVFVKKPIWSFFLSTTGKITQFSQSRSADPSNRIRLGELLTPGPYIYLGFDQLMETRKISKRNTLEDVTLLECIAHMGRPLWGGYYDHGDNDTRGDLLDFAQEKLLCGPGGEGLSDAQTYAVLSQRLALDIDTSQYLLPSVTHLTPTEIVHEQISNHMRVCISVGKGFESMRAVASSEPILSEAAYLVMKGGHGFNLPVALEKVLSGFAVSQGARGELLVAAWFTWARDHAVGRKGDPPDGALCHIFTVKELLQSLFSASTIRSILKTKPSLSPGGEQNQPPFEKVFKDAAMHFNHFIKPYEHDVLARKYLIRFMARGAAALGANCQPGFNAVYPYLYGGTDLDMQKLGFMIVQVKNDPDLDRSDFNELFKRMDPFKCKLLHESDKQDGPFPIPIIRFLFTLSSGDTPTLERMKYDSPSDGATTLGTNGQPLFTSYDYVCSGVSGDILLPVAAGPPDKWEALVNKRVGWDALFKSSNEEEILRSQLPSTGINEIHDRSWWNDT